MDASGSQRVQVTVDGRTADVPRGTTVLEAARQMGIAIPTLCYYRGLSPYGACRVCLVEIDTPRGPKQVASCSHPVEDKLVVRTDTEAVLESRRTVLELLLAQAPESQRAGRNGGRPGSRIHSRSSGRAREVHSLRALRAGLQRDDGPRGDQALRPRRAPRGGHRLRRADRPVPGLRGLRLRLPDRRRGPGQGHLAPPQAAPHAATTSSSSARPSIDLAHPQASPRVPAIDRDNCIHFQTGDCGLCSEVCQAGAIDYEHGRENAQAGGGQRGAHARLRGFRRHPPRRVRFQVLPPTW